MLLSTDLAMLPAGHQTMERLRVRLPVQRPCGAGIYDMLPTLLLDGQGAAACLHDAFSAL